MTDQPVPAPSALRDLYAAAIASYDHAVGQATDPAPGDHHYGQADAALAVRDRELERLRAQLGAVRTELAMQEGVSADLRVESRARGEKVERVRAECDRIEAAVRANPTAPDFDGAYLAAIGHIRRALDPQEQP